MSDDLKKAIELAERAKEGIEPGGSTVTEQLLKSHVKQYTRQDGTMVKEHDDSRHPAIMGKGKVDAYRSKVIWDGKKYHSGTKSGNSLHDGRHLDNFVHHESGHEIWVDMKNNVHADSREEADKYHKRGMYAEHKDGKPGKAKPKPKAPDATTPPQADSNRDKWDYLSDDENPKYALWRISSKELGNAAKGKTDLRQAAKEELANRGVDEHGEWLGFDKAKAHHGAKGFKPGHDFDADEVYGHFQTVHHKVLGAIATGHLDPKRLASEELANRGHDHNGNWIGFDKASKLHKVK